jgi:hypothetical protein
MSVYVYCQRELRDGSYESVESPSNFASIEDAQQWIAFTKENNSDWSYSVRDTKWRATPARFKAVTSATITVRRET